MAVRTTMAALIARVRSMIGDVASPQQFADQDVQDVLDAARIEVRYAVLRAEPTLGTGGIINWSDFYADLGDWEDAPATQLFGPNFGLLSPSLADTITGHWVITLPNPGQILPVFVTGLTYDRFTAAAELCRRWATTLARQFDFSTGAQSFKPSQAAPMLLRMAEQYESQARPRYVPLVRKDTNNERTFPWGPDDVNEW